MGSESIIGLVVAFDDRCHGCHIFIYLLIELSHFGGEGADLMGEIDDLFFNSRLFSSKGSMLEGINLE